MSDFRQVSELHERVADLNFEDIDAAIDTMGDKSSMFIRYCSRAVALLKDKAGDELNLTLYWKFNPMEHQDCTLCLYLDPMERRDCTLGMYLDPRV